MLSEEQKKILLDRWNQKSESPPSLKELIELIFPGKDGRSQEGREVQEFLSSVNISPVKGGEYVSKTDSLTLTDAQKELIRNNCTVLSSLELTRKIFQNRSLTNLSAEYRVVAKHLEEIPNVRKYDDVKKSESRYNPPKTFEQMVKRLNKYIYNGIEDISKITPTRTKQIYDLIGYLHKYGVIHTIEGYAKEEHRELFESWFIQYTHDKESLTEEDLTIYINVADDHVKLSIANEQINNLLTMQENVSLDNDGKKLSMSITEQISDFHNEIQQIKTRQQKAIESLQEKRKDRLKDRAIGMNLISVIDAWKKEDSRKAGLKLAKMKEEALAQEYDRQNDMESLKSEWFGISKQELLSSI